MKKNKIVYLIFCTFLFMLTFSVFIRLCYASANVNWMVSADPSSLTLTLGSSGQVTVSVSNIGGVQITVTLSMSSISGVSTSFGTECYADFMNTCNEIATKVLEKISKEELSRNHPAYSELHHIRTIAKMLDECNYCWFTKGERWNYS